MNFYCFPEDLESIGISSKKWNKHASSEVGLKGFNENGDLILDEFRAHRGKKMSTQFWSFSEERDAISVVESIHIDKRCKWKLRQRFNLRSEQQSTLVTSSVPEPNTEMLLGLGRIGFAEFARRNQKLA